ncbi:unnamed protein product [Penicillium pancosmium]
MTRGEWEAHKPEIERLYMVEGKSKTKVMQIMKSTHGFAASKWQYENQFQKWGFRKNHGGSKTWIYIRERNKRRKREKKPDGKVFINGVMQSPKSIAIGIRRNAYESMIEAHKLEVLPPTPEGVVICSPAPTSNSEQLKWPSDLPWSGHNDPESSTAQIRRKIFHTLGSVVISDATQDLESSRNISEIAMALRIFMPEEHEDEHEATARSLSRRTASHFPEVSLALYMLSNNIQFIGSQSSLDSTLGEKCHESMVLRSILQIAKVDNAQSMKKLLSLSDLTAEVLSHKIFSTSVRNHDLDMLRILLGAGLNPNIPILVHGEFPETTLQYASRLHFHNIAVDLARLLLSYGASTEPMYGGEPALAEAIISENEELITLLLDHGARPCSRVLSTISRRNYYCLRDAIYYFRMLLDVGADISGPTPEGRTLLGLTSNNLLIKWLIEQGCDVNAPQKYEFQPVSDVLPQYVDHITTPLGIAVANGNFAGIKILLDSDAEVNMQFDLSGFVSPLVLAVHCGSINATIALLDAGADVDAGDKCKLLHETEEKTLLQRAWPNKEICLALLQSGASASRPERNVVLSQPMIEAVRRGDVTMASSLIEIGAPVNPFDMESSSNAIALAINDGNTEMISLLKSSGASINGASISSVRSYWTAQYLKSVGWLSDILSVDGAQILAAAIIQGNDALISFLLEQTQVQEQISFVQSQRTPHETYASALGSAIYTDSLMLAKYLISCGALVNESDMNMIVWKALGTKHESQLPDLLAMISCCQKSIPTAFGMAIQSDNHAVICHLLEFQFSPRGKPAVFFDPVNKCVVPGRMGRCVWDERGGAWWNKSGCLFDDVELIELDSVLELAVQSGNRAILKTLLHLDIWSPQQKGQALLKSLQSNKRDMFQDLLSFGADVNQRMPGFMYQANRIQYPQQYRPSNECQSEECRLNHCSLFRCQIRKCPSCQYWKLGCPSLSALVIAMDNDDIDLSRILIDVGCDMNADLGFGFSALVFATLCQKSEFAKLLLLSGAVDLASTSSAWEDSSALRYAVEYRDKELVRLFLRAHDLSRAAPLYAGISGDIVLLEGIKSGDLELVTLLLEGGVGLACRQGSLQLRLPDDALPLAAHEGNWDVINILLKFGADVNVPSVNYGTALQVAVGNESHALIRMLVEGGADVNIPPASVHGMTALQLAVAQGNAELVDFLLKEGADVNQKASHQTGGTALQFAAIKGFIGIARKLLEAGAVVDAPGSLFYGRTAIEGAAEWGRTDVLHLLINEGSSPMGPNRRQYIRAVKLAEKQGHFPLAKFLRDRIGWTSSDADCYAEEIFDDEEELEEERERLIIQD